MELPLNTFKNKSPFVGTVKSVERIVGPNATGETCHIIIEHGGKMPFWEGQSYGVIPPGTKVNSKGKEVPHGVRLYSIASTRYGDEFDGKTATLCVRRATYWDPEKNAEDPAKKGICSNFLCDAKPGTQVNMTGPTGQVMLLPKDPATPVIMVATGTGIAPMRSYYRRFFVEDVKTWEFKGLAWLFMGVANSDAKLYDDEIQECIKRFPGQFRVDYALTREQTNKKGGKMYIQDKVEEYSEEIFQRLDGGAHMYFCGLKGMMPGILSCSRACARRRASTTTSGSRASRRRASGTSRCTKRSTEDDFTRDWVENSLSIRRGTRARRGEDFTAPTPSPRREQMLKKKMRAPPSQPGDATRGRRERAANRTRRDDAGNVDGTGRSR